LNIALGPNLVSLKPVVPMSHNTLFCSRLVQLRHHIFHHISTYLTFELDQDQPVYSTESV
jgi:hypothetical protein